MFSSLTPLELARPINFPVPQHQLLPSLSPFVVSWTSPFVCYSTPLVNLRVERNDVNVFEFGYPTRPIVSTSSLLSNRENLSSINDLSDNNLKENETVKKLPRPLGIWKGQVEISEDFYKTSSDILSEMGIEE
ncbi:hypothetical protein F7734_54875 [Scytonema sp. UIC 10036]|uniref:hypothetical protein n=1 Tax=Scytonema sp. UIC 10036 TaxID=2304196 RepID=UPI0012DA7087|nr:hypothetical protein [Scytonema sp. UIC 10036]MUH00877.1 hypothetical protein [Scytonema sp. UIC 10036]